jgi:geranylgeranyl diphosphate synthase type II
MLKERLSEYSTLVNKAFDDLLVVDEAPEKKLKEAMKYSITAGGKRLRPALILEGYRIFKPDYEKALPFACAMEMIHTFSLIHDDLPAIDNDDFRRGKPTNHKVFGECTAILAGDGLLDYAYKVISNDMKDGENLPNKVKAFDIFSNGVFDMIKGEFVDTDLEGKDISMDQLMYMHNNKTGALIKASLLIGATLAGADDVSLQVLKKYADIIGLTFQIKDDILSETGDEKILGKPVGHDSVNGKRTFVTMLGVEEANKRLDELTAESVSVLNDISDKDIEFLKELAIFIKERNN